MSVASLAELIDSRRFLGSEFLMWLWFKSECYDGMFDVHKHGAVEVIFDDRLRLDSYLAETERNTFKGGAPAFSPEAKIALREGKRPTRARLRILKEGREWKFRFKAEEFDISSLKIPALLTEREDEKLYERMALVEELEEILDRLYNEFLVIRTSNAWDEVMLPTLREWIQSDDTKGPEDYPENLRDRVYNDEFDDGIMPGSGDTQPAEQEATPAE